MEWDEITEGKTFITDLGANAKGLTARYAVWVPAVPGMDGKAAAMADGMGAAKHRIAAIGSDLGLLMERYSVERQYVFSVSGRQDWERGTANGGPH